MADVIKGRAGAALLDTLLDDKEASRPRAKFPTAKGLLEQRLSEDPLEATIAIFKIMHMVYKATGNDEPMIQALVEVSRQSGDSYPPLKVQEAVVNLFSQKTLDEVLKRIAFTRHALATISPQEYVRVMDYGTYEEKVQMVAKATYFAAPPPHVVEESGVSMADVSEAKKALAWDKKYQACPRCGQHHPPLSID